MINFKALALTALTLAATVAPVAQARPADRIVTPDRVPVTHRALAQVINKVGVTIYDGRNTKTCQPTKEGATLGYYQFHDNFVVLCTNNGNMGLMLETLAHEAVHLAQDCKFGGVDSKQIGPLGDWKKLAAKLPQYKVDTITKFYDKSDWAVEVEAFYFEDSAKSATQLVNRFCF